MTNYELANKLKELGFPIRSMMEEVYGYGNGNLIFPTLEELIEACGDRFYGLFRGQSSNWNANKIDYVEEDHRLTRIGEGGSGATPSEAVAALWIKLNEK